MITSENVSVAIEDVPEFVSVTGTCVIQHSKLLPKNIDYCNFDVRKIAKEQILHSIWEIVYREAFGLATQLKLELSSEILDPGTQEKCDRLAFLLSKANFLSEGN